MQYLGGKSRIAKEIAAIVAPKGIWWEPFCGGLSVSVQLAKYGPGVVSDANPALIALYRAVRAGWVPPTSVSREEYAAAKLLPDTDPLKAFVGFGCSFGGKWFGGYAKIDERWNWSYVDSSKRAVVRDVLSLAACSIACRSFFDLNPGAAARPESIYADPPYEGTTSYSATEEFDHSGFWERCRQWAAAGTRVYVSEYVCPVSCEIVWEKRHTVNVSKGTGEQRVERLFRVLP